MRIFDPSDRSLGIGKDLRSQIYNYAKPERRTEAFKRYIKDLDSFVRKEAEAIKKIHTRRKQSKSFNTFGKINR